MFKRAPFDQCALVTLSLTLFHIPVVASAKVVTPPMIARTIKARISPYSTAVAARVSARSERARRDFTMRVRAFMADWIAGGVLRNG